jgi:signal transduction histidine kinase
MGSAVFRRGDGGRIADGDPRGVTAELVDSLYRPVASMLLGTFAALAIGVLAWIRTGAGWALLWTAAVAAIGIARMQLTRCYRAAREPREPRRWGLLFGIGAWANGALWGAVCAAAVVVGDPALRLGVPALAFGYGVSVAARGATLPAVGIGQLLLVVLPFAAAGLATGDRFDAAFAALALLATPAPLSITLHIGRQARQLMLATAEKDRLLAELAAKSEAAEAAGRAKSRFLADMSHELRTPLNAVIGFSEVMAGEIYGPLGCPRYREYASDIRDGGAHLLAIVNDLLDLAKIEAGGMELGEDRVVVAELVAAALRQVEGRAAEKGVRLAAEPAGDLPPLLADRLRVLQMLLNLLSNAVKFTPRDGTVRVSAALRPDGGLELAVADDGPGMSAADLARALEPFGQATSTPAAERAAGTGLGLPLTKRLVEAHGGALVLGSAPGRGTRAALVFPASRVARAPA